MTFAAPKRDLSVSEHATAGEDDQYEYYIIHDGLGISHVMRHKKGVHPSIKCDSCD